MIRLLLFLVFSFVVTLASVDVINGTTTILTLDQETQKVLHKKKEIPLLRHPTNPIKKIALIPIAYRQKEVIELLHVKPDTTEVIRLNVKQGEYKKEKLTVDTKKVKPPKKVQKRIASEYHEAMKIYRTTTDERYWSDPFTLPMKSKITSLYGTARVFNETLKSFHSGTDFRAAVGTKVNAVNDGVVVLAKDRYYAGGSVLLDHGEGVYSCYYHLSGIPVKIGQQIKQGELIGLSGQSGRVTGPHLHFAFMVQGVQVDPLDFMTKINRLFNPKGVQ